MKKRSPARVIVITAICISLGFGSSSYTRTHLSVPNPVQKGIGKHSYDFDYTLPEALR